jgi:carboxymethylenebutenolidase
MFANSHEQYLAQEVGVDHADGLISRREALRRLGLMGFNAVTASSILAACAQDAEERAPASPTATATATAEPTVAPTTAEGAVAAEEITFQGPTSTLLAAYAPAGEPKGGVLVIHENRGLTDHFRSVAGRLARDGYSALALDLLSEEGGTARLGDDAAKMAALQQAPAGRFVADMKAALGELERRNPGVKLGTMGFCFGGGQVWSMIQDGDPRLAAAAPFYGTPPDPADFSKSNAAVLAVYGALDQRVNATRPAAEAALKAANLEHRILVYEGADHAFFNDTGQRYNAEAATKVYQELIGWFNDHLGS